MDRPTAYDDDVYAWAYEQAAILRRLRETRSDLPNDLDIENLSEEIESLARTDLREARSFLRLVLLHLLKIASAPHAPPVDHWKLELRTFQADLQTMITPTILRKLDPDKVWRQAIEQAAGSLMLQGDALLPGLPKACPLAPETLIVDPFDIDPMVDLLRASVAPAQPAS